VFARLFAVVVVVALAAVLAPLRLGSLCTSGRSRRGAIIATAMRRLVLVIIAAGAACGGSTTNVPAGGTSSTAIVTGDTCAVHEDATTCRADAQGCSWYLNTRPCQLGQPCPAGWCYLPQPNGAGSSGVGSTVSAACACSGAANQVCLQQIGGPAIQGSTTPAITCSAPPTNCTAADTCTCLAQGPIERCWSSTPVTNLCICDNGVR